MIKLTFCLRRKPELSREEFQAYWRGEHAELVKQHSEVLNIRRYVQSHTDHGAVNEALQSGRQVEIEAYDGVAELWFDSVEAMMVQASDPAAAKAGAELVEDEARFIDLANSPIFVTSENFVV